MKLDNLEVINNLLTFKIIEIGLDQILLPFKLYSLYAKLNFNQVVSSVMRFFLFDPQKYFATGNLTLPIH